MCVLMSHTQHTCPSFFHEPHQGSELLLLVRDQLGELVLAGLELVGVVDKVPDHELVLARLVPVLVDHPLEERHSDQRVLGVLKDDL